MHLVVFSSISLNTNSYLNKKMLKKHNDDDIKPLGHFIFSIIIYPSITFFNSISYRHAQMLLLNKKVSR